VRLRRRHRWLCPFCGSPFFLVQVGLARRKNRMPEITSMNGLLTCVACGFSAGYDDLELEKPLPIGKVRP
jgi:hypothetical protein